MHCIKKTAFTLALFLSSIVQYNYAHNLTDTDKFINSTFIKETEKFFFDSDKSNRKNLEIFRFEFQWNSDNLLEFLEIKVSAKEKLDLSILTTSHTETISSRVNVKALPIIIALGDEAQSLTVDFKHRLIHKSKASIFDNINVIDIHSGIYEDAASVINGTSCYRALIEPNTKLSVSGANSFNKLKVLVRTGGHFLVQFEVFEAYVKTSNGPLLSTFSSKPIIDGAIIYDNIDEVFIQIQET